MFRTLKLDTSAALQHGPSGNSRCPWCTLCLKISPAKRCKRLKATKNPLGSGDDGDPNVQDALVNMIKLEIGKKNVRRPEICIFIKRKVAEGLSGF